VRSAFDGIIVLDPVGRTALLPQLRAGTPVVTVGRHLGRESVPWADTDNVSGIRQLLAHLRAEGFERPALLSVDAEISYVEDVEDAYRDALAAEGHDPVIVRAAGLSEIEAYEKATQLLSGQLLSGQPSSGRALPGRTLPGRALPGQSARSGGPDAIIAASDRQSTGVLRAARELGLRVPLDVGIAGQGDTVISRNSRSALTSIRIQPRDLGAAAVEMLLELISGRTVANVTIPVDVAVRDSTRRRKRT